jgi:hypothetical protein
MLSGHAVTLRERSPSGARLIEDVLSEAGDEEEAEATARVLYRASFQELMPGYLQYDTIIWALISLLLVLAWGIGLLLLLYLPYKRYVLKRDILSRQLYVTENNIVYKVTVNGSPAVLIGWFGCAGVVKNWCSMSLKCSQATRPSYLPFVGIVEKETKIPLHLIVDVIIEQGRWKHRILFRFRLLA